MTGQDKQPDILTVARQAREALATIVALRAWADSQKDNDDG